MINLTNTTRWITYTLAIFLLIIIASAFFSSEAAVIVGLLHDSGFGRALIFSLQTSLAATFLSSITAIPAGLYLARYKGLLPTFIDTLFDIPIIMPPLIVGVLLISFFNQPLIKEFYDFIFTMPGAILAQFVVAVPFAIRACKNGFELVSPIYEQIAMTLGARPVKAFFDTTFKIAFPVILSGLILSWLRCLGEFGATLMVGGGIPGKTENIPIYIYLNMSSGEFDKGIAASVLAIVCGFCVVLVIRLLLSRKKPTTV